MNIAILGENPWAQAVAILVAEAGHIPKIGKSPETDFTVRGFAGSTQWRHLSKESDLVIFTCEADQLETSIQKAELTPRNQVLVNSGRTSMKAMWTRELVYSLTPVLRVGTIGGARLTNEVLERTPTSLVIASDFSSVTTLAHQALHSDICRIYFTDDCLGVDLAGLFVQMVNLSMGISDGLRCGTGTRGAIVSRGLIEGARLGKAFGADEHSFLGISGVGNIIAAFQDNEFYQYGIQTIQIGTMPRKALTLLETIRSLNTTQNVELPLTQAMWALGKGQLTPMLLIDKLMRRKAAEE